MLGFVLFGFYFACITCYFVPDVGYDTKKCQIRSVSSILCMCPEIVGFFLGIGNVIIFVMVHPAQPISSWVLWVSGQGVVSFLLNSYSEAHHAFLTCYMATLVYIVTQCCLQSQSLWAHAAAVYAFSFLFAGAVAVNFFLKAKYKSVQAILELYWMLSFVYFFSILDRDLTT